MNRDCFVEALKAMSEDVSDFDVVVALTVRLVAVARNRLKYDLEGVLGVIEDQWGIQDQLEEMGIIYD